MLAFLLAAVGLSLFVWSQISGKTDLLFLSLAANGLAWATAVHGWSGLRSARLSAFVLCFGVRIPKPIEDELIWFLQLGTARGSGWLLDVMGRDFFQAGVILRDAEHTFHVIDTCSGLTGNLILVLVAICAAEIVHLSGWRMWLLVGLTPLIGFLVNILRATYIAGSSDPEALAGIGADHTLQGVAVLMGGTVVVYLLAWLLGGRGIGNRPEVAAMRAPDLAGWKAVSFGLVGLFVFSLAVPHVGPRADIEERVVEFPTTGKGWTSEVAPEDPMFNGVVAGKFHRRYRNLTDGDRPLRFVDILIGQETDGDSFPARFFSSKRLFPGPDWNLVRKYRERIWILDREVDVAVASPTSDAEYAWVYAWRPRHRGFVRESWRHLLALDSGPFQRESQPTLVKIVAYAPHGGELALDRAKQRINRFVRDFREELLAL
jgi:exosortase/archaeosortase family protein